MFAQAESITQNTIVLTNSELETIAGGHDKHHCHHHHHKPHCHKSLISLINLTVKSISDLRNYSN
jgi:hypothetical protein